MRSHSVLPRIFGRFAALSFVGLAGLATLVGSGGGGDPVDPQPPAQAQAAPQITAPPQPTVVDDGANASFTVAATGGALQYQWRRNGADIAGANAATYSLTPVALADSGSRFSVVVSNTLGSVTSSEASLTVRAVAPSITTQPAAQTVAAGSSASFSVVAHGSVPLSYQWLRSGVDIPGATAATYSTPATTTGDNGATFAVRVTNAGGQVTSQTVALTVTATGSLAPTYSLAAARAFSLALRNDGSIVGWGDNSLAQIGTGPVQGAGPARQITTGASAVAATVNGGTALKAAGGVVGWGTDSTGWLGGQIVGGSATYATPVAVAWPQAVLAHSVIDNTGFSTSFHYAVLQDGTVWHLPGTVATSGGVVTHSARQALGVSDIVGLSRGQGVAYAIRRDGTVWRLSMFSVIGTPFQWEARGTQVAGLPPVKAVACSEVHCLALANSGAVWAWGEGRSGELGNGFSFSSTTPVQVLNLTSATHVAAGGVGVYGSVARTADGRVWTWGVALSGRAFGSAVNVPTEVASLGSATEVTCSASHCLARKTDGSVWGWGTNAWGELGVSGSPSAPVQVPGLNLN